MPPKSANIEKRLRRT